MEWATHRASSSIAQTMPPIISKTPFVAEGARIGIGLAKNGANIVQEEGLWVLVVVSEEPSDGVFQGLGGAVIVASSCQTLPRLIEIPASAANLLCN
jgi:hypothetical protein